jgi:hypothetical protein
MRSVLSISMPEEKKLKLLARAKKVGMNVSAYVLYTLELEESLISEDELLARVAEAEKNLAEGKVEELGSLADLMK